MKKDVLVSKCDHGLVTMAVVLWCDRTMLTIGCGHRGNWHTLFYKNIRHKNIEGENSRNSQNIWGSDDAVSENSCKRLLFTILLFIDIYMGLLFLKKLTILPMVIPFFKKKYVFYCSICVNMWQKDRWVVLNVTQRYLIPLYSENVMYIANLV